MIDGSTVLTPAGVVIAAGSMVVGFLLHEAMHIGVLTAFGRTPRLEFGLKRLFFAAIPPEGTPRYQLALALLAPIVPAAVGTWALFSPTAAGILSVPLSLDGLFIMSAYLIGSLPGSADVAVLLTYDPAKASPEVAANG